MRAWWEYIYTEHQRVFLHQWGDCAYACMLVLDVDKGSSGSKQKFCPHSIFSMSAGAGRDLWNVKMTGASWARGYEVTSWCVCAWITLPHTPSQAPDIPADPETSWYLTSSYHTWRHGSDLLLAGVILQPHAASPLYALRFENICSLQARDEFGRSAGRNGNLEDVSSIFQLGVDSRMESKPPSQVWKQKPLTLELPVFSNGL